MYLWGRDQDGGWSGGRPPTNSRGPGNSNQASILIQMSAQEKMIAEKKRQIQEKLAKAQMKQSEKSNTDPGVQMKPTMPLFGRRPGVGLKGKPARAVPVLKSGVIPKKTVASEPSETSTYFAELTRLQQTPMANTAVPGKKVQSAALLEAVRARARFGNITGESEPPPQPPHMSFPQPEAHYRRARSESRSRSRSRSRSASRSYSNSSSSRSRSRRRSRGRKRSHSSRSSSRSRSRSSSRSSSYSRSRSRSRSRHSRSRSRDRYQRVRDRDHGGYRDQGRRDYDSQINKKQERFQEAYDPSAPTEDSPVKHEKIAFGDPERNSPLIPVAFSVGHGTGNVQHRPPQVSLPTPPVGQYGTPVEPMVKKEKLSDVFDLQPASPATVLPPDNPVHERPVTDWQCRLLRVLQNWRRSSESNTEVSMPNTTFYMTPHVRHTSIFVKRSRKCTDCPQIQAMQLTQKETKMVQTTGSL
ncbi:serine/arginine repetitive matrix protein 2-like isoform X2 [Haliotis rubra]|uniref:serine/arginine repetitive matrix protein 2-like isoform X2 n=1 Tax=Haliotis rubra TaxID=36100 RepID=UPI001EE5BC21|nr:serine/arginine repetitive matrix protein 2-like isoform X2 [Haliotis rubra]